MMPRSLSALGCAIFIGFHPALADDPPPVPPAPNPPIGYSSARLLFSQSSFDNYYVIGPDYEFHSGLGVGFDGTLLLNQDPVRLRTQAKIADWDWQTSRLYYFSSNSLRCEDQSSTETVITLAEVTSAGFDVSSLGHPTAAGSRVIFNGYNYSGNDAYHIFEIADGILTELVGPTTPLPDGASGGFPYYFPDHSAATGSSFAFDTSVDSSPFVWRVFASFDGAALQLLVSVGQATTIGTVHDILDLDFSDSGDLIVTVQTDSGTGNLICDASGITASEMLSTTITPLYTGTQVSGIKVKGAVDEFSMEELSITVYFADGDTSFRVIGAGDYLFGAEIRYANLRVIPSATPGRLIVEIRFQHSASISHLVELTLIEPSPRPPRILVTDYQSSTNRLYIAVADITYGQTYHVDRSSLLDAWLPFESFVCGSPVYQHEISLTGLGNSGFFRFREDD